MNEPDPPLRNSLYRQVTRTGRRLTPARLMLYRIGAPIAYAIVRGWWAMTRVVAVLGADRLQQAIAQHGAVIPVYWHGQQLVPMKYLLGHHVPGLKPGFLVSPSVDGEVPAMFVERSGAHAVRGSSSATGARALRDYYEAITRDGVSLVITPDGPKGPEREFKPGAIMLSQLTGRPILPMAFAARHAFRFPTWDRFILPVPFGGTALAIGEPQIVPKRLEANGLADWQARLKIELDSLHAAAGEALRRR